MSKIMTKYIFVTGGVVSGLGKGIVAASLGRLLTYHIVDVISSPGVVSEGILHVIFEMLTVAVSTFVISLLEIYHPFTSHHKNSFKGCACIVHQYAFEFIGEASAFQAHINIKLSGVYAATNQSLGRFHFAVFIFEVPVLRAYTNHDTLNLFTHPANLLFGSESIFQIKYLTHAGIISSFSFTSFLYKTDQSADVISSIGLISAGVSVVK